jgi:hypothetical protein
VTPAERERVRAVLDQSRTPPDAYARTLLATAACFPPEHSETDVCLLCDLEGWSCICSPTAHGVRAEDEIDEARETRLTCAERATRAA